MIWFTAPAAAVAVLFMAPAALAEPSNVRLEIVGGTPTDTDPAVVQLISEGEAGASSLCSGTLIAPRVVLTAAHCVDHATAPSRQVVHFGTTVRGEDPGFIGRREVVEHTFYDPWSLSSNDIALLLLDEDAPVAPVPIDRLGLSEADLGSPLRLVGWGDTIGDAGDAGTKRTVMSSLTGFYNEWVMSYGSAEGNTCQGDSGGPILMERNGYEIVVGVTSWGIEGCEGTSGATRVAAYADWIDEWLIANGQPLPPALPGTRAAGDGCSVTANDCGEGLDCVGDGSDSDLGECVASLSADGDGGGCSAGGRDLGLATVLAALGLATASRRSRSRCRRCPRA